MLLWIDFIHLVITSVAVAIMMAAMTLFDYFGIGMITLQVGSGLDAPGAIGTVLAVLAIICGCALFTPYLVMLSAGFANELIPNPEAPDKAKQKGYRRPRKLK